MKNRICCVYKIINIVNSKYYIGSSSNFLSRQRRHLKDLRKNIHHSIHLQRAFNKYGEDKFKFKIVRKCTLKNLKKIEQKYLDNLNQKKCYNVSASASGGDLTRYHPNRDKIIKKATETLLKASRTDEFKKMLRSQVGEKNPNFGKRWNSKQRKRASKMMKDRFANMSEKKLNSFKSKISKIQRKYWDSEEGLKKRKLLSKKNKGKGNHFFGKKHSKKTIRQIVKKNTGRTYSDGSGFCCKITIEGVDYVSIAEASRKLNMKDHLICTRLNSTNPLYKNWNYYGTQKEVEPKYDPQAIKYRIKDKIFPSIKAAVRFIGKSSGSLLFRAKSTNPKWKDYELLRDPKPKKRKKKSRVAHLSPRKRTKTRTQTSI